MIQLDDFLRDYITRNINQSVPWFLVTSFLYYRENVSVISDEAFDWLCKQMVERWDEINHEHKQFVSLDDLRAGTGYALDWARLPGRVYGTAGELKKMAGL